jgi:SAM-dependent methyltransferase
METDWFALWRELVFASSSSPDSELIKRYQKHARKRSERPDALLDSVLKTVDGDTSVVDIGAGSGRWTIPLALKAKTVTAVEPSREMLEILRENVQAAKLRNVRVVQSTWENAVVEPHDIVLCAHAMYSSPDLLAFVKKMEQNAGQTCYLDLRLPPADGILGALSLVIYGRRHDSPNAVIAYNALYSAGIYANIIVEDNIFHWENSTVDEAFIRAKRHLKVENSDTFDQLIRDTLTQRLVCSNGSYTWPDGMRSALLWWSPHGH